MWAALCISNSRGKCCQLSKKQSLASFRQWFAHCDRNVRIATAWQISSNGLCVSKWLHLSAMRVTNKTIDEVTMWSSDNFVGGHMAVDFLNTVGDTDKSRSHNLIASPDALRDWLAASGCGDDGEKSSAPSQDDVDSLVRFRELAHRVLSSSMGNAIAESGDLQAFEAQLKSSIGRAHLDLSVMPARWKTIGSNSHYWTDRFVLLVEGFLSSPEVAKLRQCERCSWFFLNSGRGRGRRWCNMSTCGNRHKVAAHRKRQSANVQRS
ncbi:hypothetical protein TW80_13445 [Loktanella sp. S4079]|nr:hypothetical protein TW80_13445 [Loktanella sp. S4079]